ncbi:XdhC family protein, partial [Sphingobium sufflavum]|uniref:XdhC family protein n=1 Tax=Sphingobium sufflavum TaxID=1129547 RepID=UPI001F25B6E2
SGRVMAASDQAALLASAGDDMALCTLVGIEGSFSRRIGAQIAIAPDGRTVGSLSDGCLERQLAADALAARAAGEGPRVMRYGRGSPIIDFRLPCGGGLDILIDPAPDRAALQQATRRLADRQEALLPLPLPADAAPGLLAHRAYVPRLKTLLFGEGPEFAAFATLAAAMGAEVEGHGRAEAGRSGLALGQVPPAMTADRWTAILLLFHDHEWERALLRWAVTTPAAFIGAQGGGPARAERTAILRADGVAEDAIARIRSPIGLIASARDPEVLALSVLAEIIAAYEQLHPHR